MAKLTLSNVANISGAESAAIGVINANSDAIETALENTLSRNGTTPNSMAADLDMGNNDILNVDNIDVNTLTVDGVPITVTELYTTDVATQIEAEEQDDTVAINTKVITPLRVLQAVREGIKTHGFVTPLMMNADRTGATDCTTELQACMDDTDAPVFIPEGDWRIENGLILSRPKRISGAGRNAIIKIPTSFAGTDWLTLRPETNVTQPMGWSLEDFTLFPDATGIGNHAVEIDCNTNPGYLQSLSIRRMNIGASTREPGGNGIHLTKETGGANNLFCTTIEDNVIAGGINLIGVGDSVWIERNTMPGTKLAIYLEPIAGAFEQTIRKNNITSSGGAIFVKATTTGTTWVGQLTIEMNQLEQLAAWTGISNRRALIMLEGCRDARVYRNNMHPHLVSSNGSDCIYLLNSTINTDIGQRNRMVASLNGGTQFYHVRVANTSPLNNIDENNRFQTLSGATYTDVKAPLTTGISVSQIQKGVWIDATSFSNSWTAASTGGTSEDGLRYKVRANNTVSMVGYMTAGTKTASTTVWTLPTELYPTKNMRVHCKILNGAVWTPCSLILTTGGVLAVDPSEAIPAGTIVDIPMFTYRID